MLLDPVFQAKAACFSPQPAIPANAGMLEDHPVAEGSKWLQNGRTPH
jgi:hypothetical protein